MDIGIGLPATAPGVAGERVLEWARRADGGPFSSLSIIDRLAYPNYEPLVTLAAAAGATRRIGLMTSILLAPLRSTALLAKQAASVDALSGGRLTLGLAVGGREDDYRAAEASFTGRGRRFEAQLEQMRRIWAGQPLSDEVGAIGPSPARPGGPPILIEGYTPRALERAGRLADGYIAGGAPPDRARQGYDVALRAWQAAGRAGRPRLVGGLYFGLGPQAAERGAAYLRHYYAFLGPMAETIAGGIPTTPEAIKGEIGAFRDVGMDELLLWPTADDLDQVDRLADLVG